MALPTYFLAYIVFIKPVTMRGKPRPKSLGTTRIEFEVSK